VSDPTHDPALDAQARMLANRVAKTARHLRKWARREQVTCYRLYDRDIPEIPLAIDWYEGHLHIAAYARAHRPELERPEWIEAMAGAVAAALDVARDRVHTKRRSPQQRRKKYGRLASSGERLIVEEGGRRFHVNLTDYVDTGLFLDHRPTRARVGREAAGARFLNLFCYTGAFTVHAAAGGARASTSVDLSQRYLAWAADNLALNDLTAPQHRLVRADAMEWLARPPGTADADLGEYDLAVLDPPTFSNSKRMQGELDVRRDHPALIAGTLARLRRGGALYFSTNARRFTLDVDAIAGADVEDITAATTPPDFRRRVHRCWRIVRR
jgi:23S rRNA G2069 N7-methylase RlmK/C1962 C5-methylase RlmI